MIFLIVWPCLWKCFLLHVKLAIKHIFKASCRLVYYGWLTLLIPKVLDEVEVGVLCSPVKCLHTNPGTIGVTFTQDPRNMSPPFSEMTDFVRFFCWDKCEITLFLLHFPSDIISLKKMNNKTYEEKRSFINILMVKSTGSLECTETHTDPITSDLKEERCHEDKVQNCEDVSCTSNHGLYILIFMCYTLLTKVINIPSSLLSLSSVHPKWMVRTVYSNVWIYLYFYIYIEKYISCILEHVIMSILRNFNSASKSTKLQDSILLSGEFW